MAEITEVSIEQGGERLDVAVARAVQCSRAAAQKLIEQELVTVNGRVRPKRHVLAQGDLLRVEQPELRPAAAQPQDIPLNILYEDDQLLVVDKPRGMVVHPAAGNYEGTLVNALLAHCGSSLSGIGGVQRPGILHRLDKNTSGLLLVAKTDAAHRKLSAQLSSRSMLRQYEAVVHGKLKQDSGYVDAPIARDPRNRKRMAVVQDGRPARTDYRLIEQFTGFAHVTCTLTTGRTHQIRVHMAGIGHPVAGDDLYGPAKPALKGGQCLHAGLLGFVHPATGETMRFESSPPPVFSAFLEQCRRR